MPVPPRLSSGPWWNTRKGIERVDLSWFFSWLTLTHVSIPRCLFHLHEASSARLNRRPPLASFLLVCQWSLTLPENQGNPKKDRNRKQTFTPKFLGRSQTYTSNVHEVERVFLTYYSSTNNLSLVSTSHCGNPEIFNRTESFSTRRDIFELHTHYWRRFVRHSVALLIWSYTILEGSKIGRVISLFWWRIKFSSLRCTTNPLL